MLPLSNILKRRERAFRAGAGNAMGAIGKRICRPALLAVCLCIALDSRAASALYAITSFEATYSAYDPSGRAPWVFRMRIYTPTRPGTYPIAIVLGGTTACADPPACTGGYGAYAGTVAEDAARRGMIAAAVHYDSAVEHFCGCTGGERWVGRVYGKALRCDPPNDGWDDKARAVFDHGDPRSALRRIIAVTAGRAAKASLARGLVAFGHSQGSWLAHMADRYTRAGGGRAVDGALLTGTGI